MEQKENRGPGRPKLVEPSQRVAVTLPADLARKVELYRYDALHESQRKAIVAILEKALRNVGR